MTASDGELRGGLGRSLAAGTLIGALLTTANLYVGLKTGFWDSGQLTAALLGFLLLSASSAVTGRRPHPWETNLTQVTATSVCAMPAAVGLLGAVPALGFLNHAPGTRLLSVFGLGVFALGLAVAGVLDRRLAVDEPLPFPTGIATAELISSLHSSRSSGGRLGLLFAAGAALAGLIAWLRDGALGLVPAMTALPITLSVVPAEAVGVGVSWSPMIVGLGGIIGLRTSLSLLAGAALAWAGIAPHLITAHVVEGSGYEALSRWLVWPALGLMVGSSLLSLARGMRVLAPTARTAGSSARMPRWCLPVFAGGAVVVLAVSPFAFGTGLAATFLSLLLVPVLANVCARAAGKTDVAPLAAVGQLTQLIFGVMTPGRPWLNVAAGAVVAGASTETVQALWSWRAGRLLGTGRRGQAFAQGLGAVVGIALALPLFGFLSATTPIGSAGLPAPSAVQWRAIAEVASGGIATLPRGAASSAVVAAVAGLLLDALAGAPGPVRSRLPDPSALGVAFIIPASYSLTIALTALAVAAARARRPALSDRVISALGSGLMTGEAVTGVVLAIFQGL